MTTEKTAATKKNLTLDLRLKTMNYELQATDNGQLAMDITNTENMLIDYFKEKSDTTVNSRTLLLEEKIIDSMGVMELIAFIEANFGIEFTDEDLTVENFETLEAIIKIILKKDREKQG